MQGTPPLRCGIHSMDFAKFREPITDPSRIQFRKSIQIIEILNYPHAGNDVMHCRGKVDGESGEFILKLARYSEADFERENRVLGQPDLEKLQVPRVIEFGLAQECEYLVLEKLPGRRISFVLDEYANAPGVFCRQFGQSLAEIHALEVDFDPVVERRFHRPPDAGEDPFLSEVFEWLSENTPKGVSKCFIHGDHHFANILWENKRISAVLDWELAGIGNKEFDIAWAFFVRSSAFLSHFMDSPGDEAEILEGYQSVGSFNHASYLFYKVQILSHLVSALKMDPGYRAWIETELRTITGG